VSVVIPEGVEERALPAACHVINGYGKSAGLVQVDELGTLESPIVFTSVFAVPAVQDALLRRRLASDPTVGGPQEGRSVNLVVLECNDARLNDPREHICGERELASALDSAAGGVVEQGTVGAGTGMSTFGLSGGFGTASRVFGVGGREYRLGVALVSNFGVWGDLTIGGRLVQGTDGAGGDGPDGSVVIVVATDAPFDSASLRRVCVRAQNGLARTGCVTAHGSGELVVAFSTERQSVREPEPQLLNEAFRAVAEAVEEAVLSGLAHAERVTGREGRSLPVLGDLTL
jgi:D-aminopeptidase